MAQQIIFRNGSASSWSTNDPTLASGEIGVDSTNNYFKIGNGSADWNSLAIASTTLPGQTIPFRSLGDGSDGNVTVSSGVTTLSRDMFYANLTINGTGTIFTNGYKVFVKNILDLSAAPANAINFNGAAGGSATGGVAGTPAAATVSASVGTGTQGTAGASGSLITGTASAAPSLGSNGGASGSCGNGGLAPNSYTFTVTADNTASVGAIYTDGVHNYYVTSALGAGATSLSVVDGAAETVK